MQPVTASKHNALVFLSHNSNGRYTSLQQALVTGG